jgi:hypothetical protein
MNARISKIKSDGFIDRASSDLFGYYFDANYITKNTIIKAIAFGGKEKTYQAWNGLEDEEKLIEHIIRLVSIQMNLEILNFTMMKPIIIGKIIFNCIGMKN